MAWCTFLCSTSGTGYQIAVLTMHFMPLRNFRWKLEEYIVSSHIKWCYSSENTETGNSEQFHRWNVKINYMEMMTRSFGAFVVSQSRLVMNGGLQTWLYAGFLENWWFLYSKCGLSPLSKQHYYWSSSRLFFFTWPDGYNGRGEGMWLEYKLSGRKEASFMLNMLPDELTHS